MSEREEFVGLVQQGRVPVSELCRRFGISRKTGYQWRDRAATGGPDWSADRSRRPRTCPGQTPPAVEAQVVAARQANPTWGGRKLHHWLIAQGVDPVPAPSTITGILHRHGLIDPDTSAAHAPSQRFAHPAPNLLWQADFMGHLPLVSGRVHPLTLLDDSSRYVLGVWACPHEQHALVQTHLSTAFTRYGLPVALLLDNGPPWGTSGAGGITALEAWLIRLGIHVIHGRPYPPQTQGKIERLHRTLATELTRTQRFADLTAAQHAFDHWRQHYNTQRPHEALDFQVPAARYQPSTVPFPETLPPIDYGEEGPACQVRLVRSQGTISFQNQLHFISRGLRGLPVAIRPTTTDGVFTVFYCHRRVATLDLTDPSAV
jgi:transposase InsO family protein